MNYVDATQLDRNQLNIVNERVVGEQVPVSIGTALTLEHEDVDLKQWTPHLYVNLRTLLRNIYQACDRAKVKELDPEVFAYVLFEEMDAFREYVEKYRKGKTKVFYYFPSYKSMSKFLSGAQWSPGRGGEIMRVFTVEEDVRKIFEEAWKLHQKEKKEDLYLQVDRELPRGKEMSMVLSHYVVDLLSAKQFPTLYLLESHTGRVKKKPDWSSKLNIDKEKRNMFPFSKLTLQVFGDSKAILANSFKLKRALYELAEKYHWTNITTYDRMRQGVNLYPDKEIKKQLLDLF